MRFAVAMCTYNGERYLSEQLGSLLTQRRPPDELVICDDGSTDGTIGILERFANESPFSVRIIRNEKNLGYSQNFAKAIRLCNSELVALADQDDIWYPEKLGSLERVFSENADVSGVFSDGDILDETSHDAGRTLWSSFLFDRSEQLRFNRGHCVDVLLRRNVVTGMAFAIRRSAFDVLPEIPSSWIHDGWIAMMFAIDASLYALPERLVGYRVHHQQQFGTPLTTQGKLQSLRTGGFRAYRERLRARNLDEYRRTLTQFQDLLAVLESYKPGSDSLRQQIRRKVEYARRGAEALKLGPLARLPIVLPHPGSYATYSPNGLRGYFRDLVT